MRPAIQFEEEKELVMEFDSLMEECYKVAKDNGWHDRPFNFGERIGNIHSEVSEAFDEYRKHGEDVRAIDYSVTQSGLVSAGDEYRVEYTNTLRFEDAPTIGAGMMVKPEGVPVELADVCIWIFDMCVLFDIDLEAVIKQKLDYNRERPYRHGNLPF